MSLDRFAEQVRSAEELAALIGTPSAMSLKKELETLDEHMRRFIAHSPFAIISTHSADGRCDASPRGDAPGFVSVVDDRTLLIPDRSGNKRVDSFRNILETGRIGLLFLVPGFGETLRFPFNPRRSTHAILPKLKGHFVSWIGTICSGRLTTA